MEIITKQNRKDLLFVLDFLYCLFIWLLLLFIILPFLLAIFIPLYVWKRHIVTRIAKVLHPEFESMLDGYDGILALDSPSDPYATIVGMIELEGSVDAEKFVEKVIKIICDTKTPDGDLEFKKMTQYHVPFCGYYFWKKTPDLDLSELPSHFTVIHDPTSEAEMKSFASKLVRMPFRAKRPMWDVTVYTNYKEGSKSAIQIRISHAIGDGITMLNLLHEFCDYKQPPVPVALKNDYKRKSFLEKFMIVFRAPAVFLHLYLDNLTNSDIFNRTKTNTEFLVSWAEFPTEGIKLIREKTNAHFASIGLSLFGGSLMRHFNNVTTNRMENHSAPKVAANTNNENHIKIMLPLPWPNRPLDKMINHWTASFMKVPVSRRITAYERLHETNKDFWSVLYSGTPQLCRNQPPILCFLPSPILKLFVQSNLGMGIFFSSVPGLHKDDLYLLGHRVSALRSIAGPQFQQTGIFGSIFTYRGQASFNVTVNKELISTQESLDNLTSKLCQMELEEILRNCDISLPGHTHSHEFNNNSESTGTSTSSSMSKKLS